MKIQYKYNQCSTDSIHNRLLHQIQRIEQDLNEKKKIKITLNIIESNSKCK